jgi:hypothetical protein
VYPVFKLWTLALHSASMTFKLLAFNVLSDIIQSLRKCYTTSITTSLLSGSTGVDSSDPTSASYPSLAPLTTPLSVLEACLSLLPVSRLKAAAAKRLWHEMEDFPSYSRYIQVRLCQSICVHVNLSTFLCCFLSIFFLFTLSAVDMLFMPIIYTIAARQLPFLCSESLLINFIPTFLPQNTHSLFPVKYHLILLLYLSFLQGTCTFIERNGQRLAPHRIR